VEGLRALAAISIVVLHVWGFSTPGEVLGSPSISDGLSTLSVGVTLFFTLSGFLLYRPFAASIARGLPHMPIRAYLRNRVLRIVPVYWAILLIAALVLGSANVHVADELTAGRLSNPGDLASAGLLLQDYRPSTMVIGIGPAWSLAVEVVFYCVLPLLVLATAVAARLCGSRRDRVLTLLGPPLVLLLVGLSGKYVAHSSLPGTPTAGYGQNWHSVVERSFWAQADLFTFGMVVAVLYTEIVDGRLALPAYWRRAAVAMALLVFIPCAWTMHGGDQSYLLQNTGEAFALALAFAALVVPRHGPTPLRAVRILETRPLVAAGVISYSVFLWHHPIIMWLASHHLTLRGWGGLALNTLVVLILVGAFSALTYRFIELPALRRKRSVRQEAAPEIPMAPSVQAAP
jgi:peptidoglycan/LPS O-acetylase OafA/YrhL